MAGNAFLHIFFCTCITTQQTLHNFAVLGMLGFAMVTSFHHVKRMAKDSVDGYAKSLHPTTLRLQLSIEDASHLPSRCSIWRFILPFNRNEQLLITC